MSQPSRKRPSRSLLRFEPASDASAQATSARTLIGRRGKPRCRQRPGRGRSAQSTKERGMKILIAYASKHGSTREVADVIAAELEPSGLEVEVRPARAVEDPGAYDAVVLGAPLYMGRWHKEARTFL